MQKSIKLIAFVGMIHLSGCAVIHFENGEVKPDPNDIGIFQILFGEPHEPKIDAGSSIRFEKWYHHGFYQIAEISNPLDLSQVCTGLNWNQVTTQTDPIDAVVGLIDNVILFPASSAGIDLWSHWSMEYSCKYQ